MDVTSPADSHSSSPNPMMTLLPSHSPPPSPLDWPEDTAPPLHIKHTMPPSLPHSWHMHTTPSRNLHPLPQAPNQVRLPLTPLCQGYMPGAKPKAVDYEDHIEKLLLNAMHKYACLILTANAFPNEVKQTHWAKPTWLTACKDVVELLEKMPLESQRTKGTAEEQIRLILKSEIAIY